MVTIKFELMRFGMMSLTRLSLLNLIYTDVRWFGLSAVGIAVQERQTSPSDASSRDLDPEQLEFDFALQQINSQVKA